jgi:AcrR family transcriptional regulator
MAQSPKSGRQRWRRRKAARPAEILDAALASFVERGFAATRLDEVARRAGVTKGTVYLYYRSKQALFRAVVEELVVPEVARAEREVRAFHGTSADLLRKLVHDWWRTVGLSRLRGIPKLMTAESGNFPDLARYFVTHVAQRARRVFAGVLRRGMRDGEFRRCNVEYAVRVLVAPLVFAAIWEGSLAKFDKPYRMQRYLDTHLDMFLNGLSVAPGRGGRR